jgi:hypothetical protein
MRIRLVALATLTALAASAHAWALAPGAGAPDADRAVGSAVDWAISMAPLVCEAAPDTLRAMYDSGQTFDAFLAAASSRKEAWHANYARGAELDSALVARARAVRGTWRLLAVAVDGCSDSVNTLPYIARLVERVDSLDLRIVNAKVGAGVMAAHRTADGRAATPTLVLLDAAGNEAGCFIERPPPLRDLLAELKPQVEYAELLSRKLAWYAEDAGRKSVEQIVLMLEAAGAGRTICE